MLIYITHRLHPGRGQVVAPPAAEPAVSLACQTVLTSPGETADVLVTAAASGIQAKSKHKKLH